MFLHSSMCLDQFLNEPGVMVNLNSMPGNCGWTIATSFSSRHALMLAPDIFEMREPRSLIGHSAQVATCREPSLSMGGWIASLDGPTPLLDQQSGGSSESGVQLGLA